MCERPKVHAFLGAPRPSASGARRVRPPRWRRLELTWQEGRLVPAAGEAGNALHILNDDDGATQEEERSHEESTGAWREQPLPRLQEDSRWPAGQPQAQLSLRSRYLSTWTLSQALFLRGIQWAGCAAEAPPQRSQTSAAPSAGTPQLLGPVARPPQGCERLWDARSSPGRAERGGVVLEATSDGVLCSQEAERHVSPPASKSARRCEAAADERVGAFTTLLAQCADAAARYRVLVVVVHPCHLKEIKVKRGAGSLVPLASVVVTDQSGVDTTVLLWRRAALWAAAIAAGDLVFITGLQLSQDTCSGEKILQSTFSSKLLNMGHVSAPTCATGGHHVDAGSLSSLCRFLAERRPLLLRTPPRPPQDLKRLPYAPLWPRRVNTLVHALLRVTHAYVSAGEAQVQVQVLSFGFLPSQDGPRPTLDGSSPLSAVLAELSGDVTYSGCGRCAAELDADGEGIYAPCYPCLPARAVRRYYRPAVLTVSGRSTGRVRVQVPAVAVQKIVDVAPDRLLRNAAAGCEVKAVQVAAERLHALPGKKVQMAVRSLFLCDENSAPISRELTLLDLRLLPDDG
ncbi:shieldin complex subunit 2 isoform X7 [Vanacampus margaritifer]